MSKDIVPTHVGIILDGNRRWAKEKGKSSSYGHKKGFENLNKLSKYVFERGVKVLSVYAFSTENFKRSKEEVDYLMDLFLKGFKELAKEAKKNNIRVVFSGKKEPLSDKIWDKMKQIEKDTLNNKKGIFNICINYGSQSEIIDAVNKILKDGKESISKEEFEKYLYNELPPMDLMIRTSGEIRLSNFMLWQCAYAEFYFPNVYFPDFNEEEFEKAIKVFNERNRRFGGN